MSNKPVTATVLTLMIASSCGKGQPASVDGIVRNSDAPKLEWLGTSRDPLTSKFAFDKDAFSVFMQAYHREHPPQEGESSYWTLEKRKEAAELAGRIDADNDGRIGVKEAMAYVDRQMR